MEINVSDIALETVKKLLEKDKNKKGIYVDCVAGVGCGGGGSANYSLYTCGTRRRRKCMNYPWNSIYL